MLIAERYCDIRLTTKAKGENMSRHSTPAERRAPIKVGAIVILKYSHPDAPDLDWSGKEVGWVLDVDEEYAEVIWNDGETLDMPLDMLLNL